MAMERRLNAVGLRILLFLALGSSCGWATNVLEFEVGSPAAAVQNGKRRFNEMVQNSNMPTEGGSCWKSALEHLEAGCKSMSEEAQSRMTLRFVSCFNSMLGISSYICEPSTPVKTCLQQLDAGGQATFRDYFLHTQDMCYYLRQEIWQQQTNSAVTRLTDAASDVTEKMEVQKEIQQQIFESQQESLKVQSSLRKDNEDLYNTVTKVKDVFVDFSTAAKEHRMISSEIFDKLSNMQKLVSWIQGEMSLLDLIFFYFAAMVFGYFGTATPRTRAARFWLIVLYMACIAVEKFIYSTLTERKFDPEDVQVYRWYVRKFAAGVACFIVLIEGARYRDIQKVNHNMLTHMSLTVEKLATAFFEQQAQGANPELAPNGAAAVPPRPQRDGAESSSDEESDTFSNYSTDDSADNLDNELKDLLKEDIENNQVQQASVTSTLGRLFGRERNKKASPLSVLERSRHTYNLRERSTTPHLENPAYQHESTTEFARLVKKKVVKAAPAPPPGANYFSSDEEY